MLASQSQRARQTAWLLIVVQIAVVLLASCIMILLRGLQVGYSVLLGGAVYIIPGCYFAFRLFSDMRARSARKIISRFFVGEITKLSVSAVLFILLIKFLPVDLLGCLIGYGIATIGFWFAPLICRV